MLVPLQSQRFVFAILDGSSMLLISDYTVMFVLVIIGGSPTVPAPSSSRNTLDAILKSIRENAPHSDQGQGGADGDTDEGRLRRDVIADTPDVSFGDALHFLSDFNYLPGAANSDVAASSISHDAVAGALRNMQIMAGIEVTGELDDATKRVIISPRCGVPDNPSPGPQASRQKRFVLRDRLWSKRELTYRIINYTPDLNPATVDQIIQQAFQTWQTVTMMTFTRVTSGDVDIRVEFVTGDHGDGLPFDGPRTAPRPGVRLAHAFFPINGDVHFDDDEVLTNDHHDINLLQLAVHEIGHSLGLEHSNNKDAVMTPYYEYRTDFNLHRDDVVAVQTAYGPPTTTTTSTTTTTAPPEVTPRPVTCPRNRTTPVRYPVCGHRCPQRLPSSPLLARTNCPTRTPLRPRRTRLPTTCLTSRRRERRHC